MELVIFTRRLTIFVSLICILYWLSCFVVDVLYWHRDEIKQQWNKIAQSIRRRLLGKEDKHV